MRWSELSLWLFSLNFDRTSLNLMSQRLSRHKITATSCLEQVSAYRKWAITIQTERDPFPTRRDCTGGSLPTHCGRCDQNIPLSLTVASLRVFGYRGHRRRNRGRASSADDADDYSSLWSNSFSFERWIPSSNPILVSLLLLLVCLGE